MSKKHKRTILNYIEHFLSIGYTMARCISIFAFASLLGIPIGITSSSVGLKICAITAGIKKYNLIIKKKKHNKIVLLAKSKLNSIEVRISKALIDSVITHDEFVVINNVLNKRICWHERRSQKSKDLNSSLKILVYF